MIQSANVLARTRPDNTQETVRICFLCSHPFGLVAMARTKHPFPSRTRA